jgi:hypothetical protein
MAASFFIDVALVRLLKSGWTEPGETTNRQPGADWKLG